MTLKYECRDNEVVTPPPFTLQFSVNSDSAPSSSPHHCFHLVNDLCIISLFMNSLLLHTVSVSAVTLFTFSHFLCVPVCGFDLDPCDRVT